MISYLEEEGRAEDAVLDARPTFGKRVSFRGLSLEEAISAGGFDVCHPYIRWPNFGAARTAPGIVSVEYRDLSGEDTPEILLERCRKEGFRFLTASELAEVVAEYPEDILTPLVAIGEYIQVATSRGFPCALEKDGKRLLTLWYYRHELDWPPKAKMALRAP